ncbi:flp pilus assembly protein, secretin [Halanaerobium saccharolyticum subsp. saccharolyticum DSM 6643]|uniref:Flp pilus assembly protein, secretin n=1 Tax=Halanaerobium saccharolyticum subsp. saccharolyticum DSM 6643 TaxID=1293054 RepID=M5E0T9_9FIRM|nr:type II and III secretion system protein [Halanaerobium saccharolyticum]CCU79382.1 flp pilus assembly protein, secretin [Halanaerobium saccharolyticum subsp. saccharolyticum DSM 6643]
MRDNKKITALILILVFILSATAAVGAQGRINDMNFKNADLTDVLRAIAEVANVNLITDSNVSGTITIHLKDISFNKALDLITQTRSLTYKWDENTVVVASPDRIEEIYSNMVTEFVEVKSNDLDNISVIVKDIFPDTQITADSVRRQFILKGEEERVVEIREMIERLDTSAVAQKKTAGEYITSGDGISTSEDGEIYTESYKLFNAELADLRNKLLDINSDLSIRSNPLTNNLIISGNKVDVENAISMAKTYDESLEPETRNIRVDYVDTEQINEIVGKFYPNVKLHVNAKRKEIIINGARNKLDGVEELIKEINKPQYQVVIETRVEEISSNFNRQFGIENLSDFSSIEFIKDLDGDITELDYDWPQFFKALDESEDSETLANPRLMTLNGETASMDILDEEPYVTDIERNDDGILQYSYDYVEAGVILEFTPWITENDEIELQIIPEVSSFQIFDPQEQKPPSKKSRRVETRLRLKDGETIVIGGLIQTTNDGVITKIPLLGDIPILGELFKTRNKNENVNELVIFVTPRIIKYDQTVEQENHLIDKALDNTTKVVDRNPKGKEIEEMNEDQDSDKALQEYLEERDKRREEILNSLKDNKSQEQKEFQELTPEELEALINNN